LRSHAGQRRTEREGFTKGGAVGGVAGDHRYRRSQHAMVTPKFPKLFVTVMGFRASIRQPSMSPVLESSQFTPAAESDAAPAPVATTATRRRGWFTRCASALDWIFGFAAVIAALAVCSVIPVLNFLSLGYLLHVSGTVARTGRLRDGFIGVRKASALGSMVVGVWLVLWPARILSGFWKDAELIAPGGPTASGWRVALIVVAVLTFLHIAWAGVRGGRLAHFLWPAPMHFFQWLRAPDRFENIQRVAGDYVLGLRLPFYFWLGLRGFVGAVAWLVVPVGLLLVTTRLPVGAAALLSLPALLILLVVAIHLPFLQAHFAECGRFAAMFEWREVRARFRRAPLAFWLALVVTLLFAIPLYLLKVELTPRELAWLPSLLFVAFIFPARILTGWATSRALRRERDRHWTAQWLGRLAILPVAMAYALMVYLTPYLSWNGARSLLEQHAFLVPAPLMAL
jgi:hypothetical protein